MDCADQPSQTKGQDRQQTGYSCCAHVSCPSSRLKPSLPTRKRDCNLTATARSLTRPGGSHWRPSCQNARMPVFVRSEMKVLCAHALLRLALAQQTGSRIVTSKNAVELAPARIARKSPVAVSAWQTDD